MTLKKTFTILVLCLGLIISSTAFAGDDIDNEAACQYCLNQVETMWQECVAIVQGDEGDAACAAARRDGIANCQREVCID